MATNAMKYYASYMQSHTERMQKFRDEAYNELVTLAKNDLAYRKLLQQREKALVDAAGRLRAAKPTGDAKLDFDAFSLILRGNEQIINASEDAAKRGIEIEKSLKNALTPSKQSNDKIAEMEQTLATAGAVSGNPDVVVAAINNGIDGIVGTVSPGSTQAAAAAQNAFKALSGQPGFNSLSPAQKEGIRQRLTTSFGLDTVNIAGASGITLLDVPQDVLVDRELDRQLQQYGGAYGVRKAQEVIKKVEDALALSKSGDNAAAAKAIDDAKQAVLGKIEGELPDIQAELAKIPDVDLSEANVRRLAREKYGPEAATFMKQQFERDALGGDQTSLAHYDALQVAKAGTYKPGSDARDAVRQYLDNNQPAMNKREERERALQTAIAFASKTVKGKDGKNETLIDKDKRDAFLVAYHQARLEDLRGRIEPSNVVPEPTPPAELLRAPPSAPIPDTGRVDFQRRPGELEPQPGGTELRRAEQAALGSPLPARMGPPSAGGYYDIGREPSLTDMFRNELDLGTRVGGAPMTSASGEVINLQPAGRFEKFATKYMTDEQRAALMLDASPDVYDLISGTLKRAPTPEEIQQAQVIQATVSSPAFMEMKRKKEEERIINEAADRLEQRRRDAGR